MTAKIFYTVTEAADMLSLSRATIYTLCSRGDLRCTRLGGRILVDITSVREKLQQPAGIADHAGIPDTWREELRSLLIEHLDGMTDRIIAAIREPEAPDANELPAMRRSMIRPVLTLEESHD